MRWEMRQTKREWKPWVQWIKVDINLHLIFLGLQTLDCWNTFILAIIIIIIIIVIIIIVIIN